MNYLQWNRYNCSLRKTMSTDLVIERDLQRLSRTWDLEEICSRIAGGEALSQIALSYGKSKQALWKYLNKEDECRKQYLQALESRGIAHLEEIERIAVDSRAGHWMPALVPLHSRQGHG